MKRKILLVSMLSLGLANVFGQQTESSASIVSKVETNYYRPSITNIFVSKSGMVGNVMKNISSYQVPSLYDSHGISFRADDANIEPYFGSIAKAIVEKWFSRDAQGNFNTKLLEERGQYTATDADVLENKNSVVNRIEMLGSKLLTRSYVVVWDLGQLKTTEKRGFELEGTYKVYKLEWTPEVEADFYQNYWTDAQNYDANKVANWGNAKFSLVPVLEGEVLASEDRKGFLATKEYTDEEMLNSISERIHSRVYEELEEKIEELKPKATVYSAYPITAKIGTKEGLKNGKRYFAYEIRQDENGNQTKYRKGVLRAKKVMDNDGQVNDGESDVSTFQQQGGWAVHPGMLLESKPDLGLIFNIGYTMSSNKAYSGVDFGLKRNLGANNRLSINFNIAGSGTSSLSKETFAWSGNIAFSREMYLANKGNFYIEPSLGIGIHEYSLAVKDNKAVSNILKSYQNEGLENLDLFAFTFNASAGAGYHITPWLSAYGKVGMVFNTSYAQGSLLNILSGDKKQQYSIQQQDFEKVVKEAENDKSGWGLDKLSGGSSAIISFGLNFKF